MWRMFSIVVRIQLNIVDFIILIEKNILKLENASQLKMVVNM